MRTLTGSIALAVAVAAGDRVLLFAQEAAGADVHWFAAGLTDHHTGPRC